MPPPSPEKRVSSSSSPALGCSMKKVCLICRCHSFELQRQNNFLDIFVLDLNDGGDHVPTDDEFISRTPDFRLDTDRCFQAGAFCAFDSTLCMFESAYPDSRHGKSVTSLDLSSSKSASLINVEPNMLVHLHDMLYPKLYPAALPTPDRKILIFSNLIKFDDNSATNIDFELYDPANATSLKLPQLCRHNDGYRINKDDVWIEGYTLHEESSTFYIRTRVGMFCLDISSPYDKGWVVPDSFLGSPTIPCKGGPFFVIGDDELCFTPFGFFDMKRQVNGGFAKCAWFPVDLGDVRLTSAVAVPLGGDLHGSGEFVFCLVHTGMDLDDTTVNPRLVMNVCRCNVKTFREDTKTRKTLRREVLISFKFLLNDRLYSSFRAYDMFAI